MKSSIADHVSPGVLPEWSSEDMVEVGNNPPPRGKSMAKPYEEPIKEIPFTGKSSPVAENPGEYTNVLRRLYDGELLPATIETLVGPGDDLSDVP